MGRKKDMVAACGRMEEHRYTGRELEKSEGTNKHFHHN